MAMFAVVDLRATLDSTVSSSPDVMFVIVTMRFTGAPASVVLEKSSVDAEVPVKLRRSSTLLGDTSYVGDVAAEVRCRTAIRSETGASTVVSENVAGGACVPNTSYVFVPIAMRTLSADV